MDCQKAGLLTLFKDCCKNRGKIISDTGGALPAAVLAGTASVIFEGASAAFAAFSSGASAASAASAGTAAMASAAGPAFLAVGAAYLFSELLGLGCDQQDMETGMLAGSGLCHYVGTYCSAKLPFIGCIQKVKSHCCFNSKLGRIIHEQGRAQLKGFSGWGTPKEPRCEGFTPEQFQALNFADIDLSEYYGELAVLTEGQLKGAFEEGLEAYINLGETPDD
ncbi:conjugal transfer protein TraN [Kordiimonas pumila]|uniref:Conjugal transfer protein TraN n=1 Tax=Kordiimonas pumila TaxID=2161677 RepID=A0ABV7D595_9PROT